jgi:hypothetical protein
MVHFKNNGGRRERLHFGVDSRSQMSRWGVGGKDPRGGHHGVREEETKKGGRRKEKGRRASQRPNDIARRALASLAPFYPAWQAVQIYIDIMGTNNDGALLF